MEWLLALVPFLADFGKDVVILALEFAGTILVPWMLWQLKELLKSKIHDARFHCATEKLHTLASQAVAEAQQGTVKVLKKAGEWNQEVAYDVKAEVIRKVKKHLGKRGLKELRGCLGLKTEEVNSLVATYVESSVAKLKARAIS